MFQANEADWEQIECVIPCQDTRDAHETKVMAANKEDGDEWVDQTGMEEGKRKGNKREKKSKWFLQFMMMSKEKQSKRSV